jgi:hypothetical protein
VVKLAPVSADVAAAGHSTARSGRWRSARFPWIASGVVYTVLVVLCTLAGYWLMFSQFAVYDDEGFFDYSLQLFVNGHPLYSSVFSPYGPFYYVVFGGFFALVGHDVTTNAGRLIQLTIWVTVSLGIGVTAHRLTGRLTIGVASLATAFLLLAGLTSEPMHAAALACLLLTALVAVAAFVVRSGEQAGLAAVGAICAALLLTKINVGGFAAIAIVFAAVLAGGSLLRVRPLRWLVIAAFVLVGPALMVSKLNAGWARSYAIVAALSTLSLVLVALPTRIELLPRDASLRWLRPLIGGFVAVVLLVLAIVFALGTRPGDLINQIIVVPSRQDDILQVPITLNGNVIWWSLAATVLAWTMREGGLLAREERPARVWDGLLRTAVGVAILLSLAGQSVFSVAPNARFSLAMPLAWVAALPSRRDSGEPLERMVRLLIPALAILEALQAFPVAGTQVDLGSLLLVLCGAVCLADGWAELVACDEERAGRPALARAGGALRRPGGGHVRQPRPPGCGDEPQPVPKRPAASRLRGEPTAHQSWPGHRDRPDGRARAGPLQDARVIPGHVLLQHLDWAAHPVAVHGGAAVLAGAVAWGAGGSREGDEVEPRAVRGAQRHPGGVVRWEAHELGSGHLHRSRLPADRAVPAVHRARAPRRRAVRLSHPRACPGHPASTCGGRARRSRRGPKRRRRWGRPDSPAMGSPYPGK